MRERIEAAAAAGPVTRSREHDIRQEFVMEAEIASPPGAGGPPSQNLEPIGDQPSRVLVSEPLQRNIEAARMFLIEMIQSSSDLRDELVSLNP